MSVKLLEYGMNQKLVESSQEPIVLSPYVTIWAKGNYYILAKREGMEQLEHIRIEHMKDITILERGVDMIFGGINPGQYAKHCIYLNGESKEKYELECRLDLWQEIAECFGTDAMVLKESNDIITVKINTIPSVIRPWGMKHLNQCEVISPKRFRNEIQLEIMEAYKKYCS